MTLLRHTAATTTTIRMMRIVGSLLAFLVLGVIFQNGTPYAVATASSEQEQEHASQQEESSPPPTAGSTQQQKQQRQQQQQQQSKKKLYKETKYVQTITMLDTIHSSDGIWMIQFCHPMDESCQAFVSQYNLLATITRGIYNIGYIDSSTSSGQEIVEYYNTLENNDHYDTSNGSGSKIGGGVKLILLGENKKKPLPYVGQPDVQNMLQRIMELALETLRTRAGSGGGSSSSSSSSNSDTSSDGNSRSSSSSSSGSSTNNKLVNSKVIELTSSNFQEQILNNPLVSAVAFVAQWCGHCKRLLPEWIEAAQKLDGLGAILGWVDATVETDLAVQYGIQSYPTIKVFPGSNTTTTHPKTQKQPSDAKDYPLGGDRTTATMIVQNILKEVDQTGQSPGIPQLIHYNDLQEKCGGSNQICVLGVLPHILDSGALGRNRYRDVLYNVSKTFRGSSFRFLWFEGTSQPTLEETLDLTFGYPAMVALSLNRQAYSVMTGSFSEKVMTAFLHGVTTGRQPTIKLSDEKSFDTLVVPTEPWDGLDGAPIEEEMSLDEIMGWGDNDDDGDKDKDENDKTGEEL